MACYNLPQSLGKVECPEQLPSLFSKYELSGDVLDVVTVKGQTTFSIGGRNVTIISAETPKWLKTGIKMRIKIEGGDATLEKLKND